MNQLRTSKIEITERKIRYDSTIVDYDCLLLKNNRKVSCYFTRSKDSFTMTAHDTKLTIQKEVTQLHTTGKIVLTIYTYGEIRKGIM